MLSKILKITSLVELKQIGQDIHCSLQLAETCLVSCYYMINKLMHFSSCNEYAICLSLDESLGINFCFCEVLEAFLLSYNSGYSVLIQDINYSISG